MTHTSVKETQRLIDAREFAEWMAVYRANPWGPVLMKGTCSGQKPSYIEDLLTGLVNRGNTRNSSN